MVGLSSYDVPRKEAWRGWQWNQIVAHLPEFKGRPVPSRGSAAERLATSTKTVLYLCGPDHRKDLDCALARGFANHNCIGVDINQENIERMRKDGAIGICGDLRDVLIAWKGSIHIDAVVADFCCGFDKMSLEFISALTRSEGVDDRTVIAINLQRGRDGFSNKRRGVWSRCMPTGCELHRGLHWFCELWSMVDYEAYKPGLRELLQESVLSHCDPKHNSYRSSSGSSNVYFDSVVCRFPGRRHPGSSLPASGLSVKAQARIDKVGGRVAAAKAIRSLRMNGRNRR